MAHSARAAAARRALFRPRGRRRRSRTRAAEVKRRGSAAPGARQHFSGQSPSPASVRLAQRSARRPAPRALGRSGSSSPSAEIARSSRFSSSSSSARSGCAVVLCAATTRAPPRRRGRLRRPHLLWQPAASCCAAATSSPPTSTSRRTRRPGTRASGLLPRRRTALLVTNARRRAPAASSTGAVADAARPFQRLQQLLIDVVGPVDGAAHDAQAPQTAMRRSTRRRSPSAASASTIILSSRGGGPDPRSRLPAHLRPPGLLRDALGAA